MEIESDRIRFLSRRAAILGGGKLLLASALVARMYQLQILDADQYQMLAEENRIDLRLLPPLRGKIVDRFGKEIATNKLNYRVILVPEQTDDPEETLRRLSRFIELGDARIQRILRRVAKSRPFVPVSVAENLPWEDFARVNTRVTELPGIQPDAGQTRYYPFAYDFALLAGYVGPVTEEELDRLPEDPMFLLPEFRIGKRGLELKHDELMRGSAGTRRVEVNALGREIRELNRVEGVAGQDLYLSVDMDLQRKAVDVLGQQSAGAVVMNVHSGEVVLMASTPGFDANYFTFGISHENWQGLLYDPRKPLINKALQGQFPPGSTFKMIVAMAALEAGVIDQVEKVTCWGKYRFGDRTFHCWKERGHGHMKMHDAIEQSCDIYFYEVAQRVGIERIAAMAKRFGLGGKTGIEMDIEAPGLVPTPEWKRERFGKPWVRGETLSVGIGQGAMLSTPLQLATMTARIANGGYAVVPRLLRENAIPVSHASDRFASLGVSEMALGMAQRGMIGVTMGDRGTARGSKIREEGLGMAGKTGTAQVRRITEAERQFELLDNEDKPWAERDHSLFVGYGPIENPAYSVGIIVQHGGSGSRVAAPMARDILKSTMLKDPCKAMRRPDTPSSSGSEKA